MKGNTLPFKESDFIVKGTIWKLYQPELFNRPLEKVLSTQSCPSDEEESSFGGSGPSGKGPHNLTQLLSDKARQIREANDLAASQ